MLKPEGQFLNITRIIWHENTPSRQNRAKEMKEVKKVIYRF